MNNTFKKAACIYQASRWCLPRGLRQIPTHFKDKAKLEILNDKPTSPKPKSRTQGSHTIFRLPAMLLVLLTQLSNLFFASTSSASSGVLDTKLENNSELACSFFHAKFVRKGRKPSQLLFRKFDFSVISLLPIPSKVFEKVNSVKTKLICRGQTNAAFRQLSRATLGHTWTCNSNAVMWGLKR